MHWVIQEKIFKPINYQLLTESLNRHNIPHTSVSIPPQTFTLSPDVLNLDNVYVCGAIKMARIAKEKGWYPGSFLNGNYDFSIWLRQLGKDLLNADFRIGKLIDVDVNGLDQFFIRPAEDNKAFDGMIMNRDMLLSWCRSDAKKSIHALNVIVTPVKKIYQEYRFFVVESLIVTASCYKMGGKPFSSSDVPNHIEKYVESIIEKWLPSTSVVIDIALTEEGLKVIEFNNINSSGFYSIDIDKYVLAIEQAYNQNLT